MKISKEENQIAMYGMTAKDIDAQIEGMIYSDPQMYCTSLLSDLQEILGSRFYKYPIKLWPRDRENIRQTLNVVKRTLNVHMKNKGRHIDLGGSE